MMATTCRAVRRRALTAERLAPYLRTLPKIHHQAVSIHDLRDGRYMRDSDALQSNKCRSSDLKPFHSFYSPNAKSRLLSTFTRHKICGRPEHSAAQKKTKDQLRASLKRAGEQSKFKRYR